MGTLLATVLRVPNISTKIQWTEFFDIPIYEAIWEHESGSLEFDGRNHAADVTVDGRGDGSIPCVKHLSFLEIVHPQPC